MFFFQNVKMSFQNIEENIAALKKKYNELLSFHRFILLGKFDQAIYDGLYKGGLVNVRTLTGGNIPIHISYRDKVGDLQKKIAEKKGIPVINQRLIFGGKKMKPYLSLYLYRLPIEGFVNLSINLHPAPTDVIPPDPNEVALDIEDINIAHKKYLERQDFIKNYSHLYKLT